MTENRPKCDKCPTDLLLLDTGKYFCVECGEEYSKDEVCFPIDRNEKQPFDPMQGVYILGNVLAVLSGYVGISVCFVKLILEVFQDGEYKIYSTSLLKWSIPMIILGIIVNVIPLCTPKGRDRVRTIILQALKIVIGIAALIVLSWYLLSCS